MQEVCKEIHAAWWQWHPPVGVAAGVAGLVAIFFPLTRSWDKISRKERALWVFVFVSLFGIEFRTIYLDRSEADQEHALATCRQVEQFRQTVASLKSVLDKATQASDKATDALNNLTGDKSYVFVRFSSPMGPFDPGIAEAPKGSILINGSLQLVGEYPLHDVYVVSFCSRQGYQDVNAGTVFPHEIGRPRQGVTLQLPSKPQSKDERFCPIWINTSNGSYAQIVRLTKVGSRWMTKSVLTKSGEPSFRHTFNGEPSAAK
jgi:hypothetical protein